MATDLIRYDLLVQNALRGVVRKVLTDAARDGVPGDHHYYISFLTAAPGVRISNRLREKYPDEMTIVLQHQFWDLGVTEHAFEVGLAFGGIPERLLVPFEAVTGFFDPSVQFVLKFEASDGEDAESEPAPATRVRTPKLETTKAEAPKVQPVALAAPAPAVLLPKRGDTPEKAPARKLDEPKPALAAKRDSAKDGVKEIAKPATAKEPAKEAPKDAAREGKPTEKSGAEVLSLDAFRKKS